MRRAMCHCGACMTRSCRVAGAPATGTARLGGAGTRTVRAARPLRPARPARADRSPAAQASPRRGGRGCRSRPPARRRAAAARARSPARRRSRAPRAGASRPGDSRPSATTRQVEAVAEVDRRAGDLQVAVVGLDAGDERAVDLELVEREVAQAAERRTAAAEVVERHAHAERAEPAQRRAAASSGSSRTARSVTSSCREPPGTSYSASRAATRSGNPGSSRSRAETFTVTSRAMPSARQSADCSIACASTVAVTRVMRCVGSAIGMKASGSSSPSCGCAQRTSASTPTTSPRWRSSSGW